MPKHPTAPPDDSSEHFDAFLSYAHEDTAVAEWLRAIVATTWLPGRARRRVFFDRVDIVPRGSLPGRITSALQRSETLIVLCSRDSAASDWVHKEIETFLSVRGVQDMILVHVGAPGGPVVPAVLSGQLDGPSQPLQIDLRARPGWRARRTRAADALRIAAAVANLKSADALLDRRARWLRRSLVAFDGILLLSVVWMTGHLTWRDTAYQRHERAVIDVAATMRNQQLDDPRIQSGLLVLLDEERRDLFDRAARSAGAESTRRLLRAAAFAHAGRCEQAKQELVSIDAPTRWIWRRTMLPIVARCTALGPAEALRHGASDLDSEDLVAWATLLGNAGFGVEARAVIARIEPGPERARATIAVALTDGPAAAQVLPGAMVEAPCGDDAEEILDRAELVAMADLRGLLDVPPVRALVVSSAQCLALVELRTELVWTRASQLAAALSAIAESGAARRYLEQLQLVAQERPAIVSAEGLVWQGIALQRLHDQGADARFRRAGVVLFGPIEASRSWVEAAPIVIAFSLAGRWNDAFTIAAAVPDAYGRTLAELELLIRWREVGRHRARWARWAPELSWVFGRGR
jgi:hypothetical protein